MITRPLLAAALAAAALGPTDAHADNRDVLTKTFQYVYRRVNPPIDTAQYKKPMPPAPGQTPKTVSYEWTLKGVIAVNKSTKITSLGYIEMTFFILDGAMLGNGPMNYWPSGGGSTVGDFCNMVFQVPQWTCSITGDGVNLTKIKVDPKAGQPSFYSMEGYSMSNNSVKMFGRDIYNRVVDWKMFTGYTY